MGALTTKIVRDLIKVFACFAAGMALVGTAQNIDPSTIVGAGWPQVLIYQSDDDSEATIASPWPPIQHEHADAHAFCLCGLSFTANVCPDCDDGESFSATKVRAFTLEQSTAFQEGLLELPCEPFSILRIVPLPTAVSPCITLLGASPTSMFAHCTSAFHAGVGLSKHHKCMGCSCPEMLRVFVFTPVCPEKHKKTVIKQLHASGDATEPEAQVFAACVAGADANRAALLALEECGLDAGRLTEYTGHFTHWSKDFNAGLRSAISTAQETTAILEHGTRRICVERQMLISDGDLANLGLKDQQDGQNHIRHLLRGFPQTLVTATHAAVDKGVITLALNMLKQRLPTLQRIHDESVDYLLRHRRCVIAIDMLSHKLEQMPSLSSSSSSAAAASSCAASSSAAAASLTPYPCPISLIALDSSTSLDRKHKFVDNIVVPQENQSLNLKTFGAAHIAGALNDGARKCLRAFTLAANKSKKQLSSTRVKVTAVGGKKVARSIMYDISIAHSIRTYELFTYFDLVEEFRQACPFLSL